MKNLKIKTMRKFSRIATILLVLTMSSQAYSQGSQGTKEDEAAIRKVVDSFFECVAKKDKETFLSLFANQEISWVGAGSIGKMVSSPSDFMDQLKAGGGEYGEDLHNLSIWNDEFIAVVTFDYGFITNGKVTNWGKESWMLIKENSQWKITSFNFSVIMSFKQPYPFEIKN